MSEKPSPESSILLYQTEDGRTRIQCRFEHETLLALPEVLSPSCSKPSAFNINQHLGNIYEEGELDPRQLSGNSG